MAGRVIAWGAGAGVVLAAVTGALINELHGGWPWWVAAGAVTLLAAGLAGWVAARASDGDRSVVVEAGAVYAGQDIDGQVRARPQPAGGSPQRQGVWRWIGSGGVFAGRRIGASARIDTTGRNASSQQGGSSAGPR